METEGINRKNSLLKTSISKNCRSEDYNTNDLYMNTAKQIARLVRNSDECC